jgi:thiamine pyrophosphokinase
MKWAQFLESITDADHVTLVGPLYNKKHVPLSPTIYVDGGARFASGAPVDNPVVSVGDGDSGDEIALDENLPAEKDYSDLAFVLRGLPQSVSRVEMLGFQGGRKDHDLCNLGEVHAFLATRSYFTTVEFKGDEARVIGFCKGRVNLEIRGPFSVFVLEPAAVKISGECKYQLSRERTLGSLSSVGLSNEAHGAVEIECGPPAFVVIPG